MTDDGLQLTRRKLLAATTAVGAAGVGAGLGTSALFSDEESFTGNILEAGSLNLLVSADVKEQNSELPSVTIESGAGQATDTADGNVVTITASDMKPGDWFILQWEIQVCGNPGHVQVTSVDEDFENAEGRTPEAETDTDSPGDLGDALLTTVWHDYQTLGGSDVRQYLGDLDDSTDNADSGLSAYETPDLDGATGSGAHYTTVNEAHDAYKGGVVLRDTSTHDPLEVGCTDEGIEYYQLFELPRAVGNDVQGDSVTFTLRFDAEQVRNNPDPFA